MVDEEILFQVIAEVGRKGADFCDVFVEERTTYQLRLEEGRVQENVSGAERGAGIRVLVGETAAYAYTNSLERESLLEAAKAAAAAARSGKGGSFSLGGPRRLSSPLHHPVLEEPDSVEREFKLDLVSRVDRSARAAGTRVSQVVVILGEGRQRVLVANSLGELAEDERTRVRIVAQVVARKGKEAQTGTESPGILGGYELFRSHTPEEIGRKAAEQALVMLEARQAPTGPMPVVIANATGGVLFHEACGHGLEADAVYKGASVFAGRLGERVASPLVFAYDDATLPQRWGSFRFDDEGVPATRTPLIEEGVLVGYINDRKRAMRDGVTATGNGRRQSYRYLPIPRMTNTFIAAGSARPEDIIADTALGLYAKKLGGGEVNPVTGDFIFSVTEGYMIRGGRLAEPVRGATLIGNGPKVLRDIDAVADDLDFDTGMCGKDGQLVPVTTGQPTLRVRELVVGGTTEVI